MEVQLFALARDLAAEDRLIISIHLPASAASVKQAIVDACPHLQAIVLISRLAVNQSYVNDDFVIQHDSEIALIPPVSGG